MSSSIPRSCCCYGLIAALFFLGAGCSEDSPIVTRVSPPPAGKSCFDFRDYLHATGYLETAGVNNGVAFGAGHVFVVGDDGLTIVDAGQGDRPEVVATVSTSDVAWDVEWADSVAFIACGGAGLVAVDVSVPASPKSAGVADTPGRAVGIDVAEDLAYLADDVIGLMIFDVSDPASPVSMGVENTPGKAMNVVVAGGLAYVADETLGLRVVNVYNPGSPWLLNTVPLDGWPCDVCFYRGYVVVAARGVGVHVVNVSVPGSEFLAGSMDTPGSARGVVMKGATLFIADESSGLRVIDLRSPPEPKQVNFVSSLRACRGVAVSGEYAYTVETDGVRVIDARNPKPPPVIASVLPGGTDPVVYDPSFFIDCDSTLLFGIARGQALFVAEYRNGGDFDVISEHDRFYLEPADLLFKEGVVVVADRDAGGNVYDVSDPYSPLLVDDVRANPGTGMDLADSVLYSVSGSSVLGVTRIGETIVYSAAAAGAEMMDVAVYGGYAFVTSGTRELIVADVSDYTNPFVLARLNIGGGGGDILVRGGHAYVALSETDRGGRNGVAVYDLQYPFFPMLVGIVPTLGRPGQIDLDGAILYAALGEAGLEVIDISDPLDPLRIGYFGTDTRITDVAAGGGCVFVAEDDTGVFVIRAQTCATP